MTSNLITSIIMVVIALLGLFGFFSWQSERDALFQAAVQDYEECVQNETGVSPSEYYQIHNYYPECY